MSGVAEATTLSGVLVSSRAGAAARSNRFVAIDWLRGAAMLLMALDHWAVFVRININAEGYGGAHPSLGSTAQIVTGLLTNLASGIFFTLMGTSVAFFERSRRKRGWTEWHITRFLLIRAGVLLVLDQVINRIGWSVMDLPLIEVLSAIAFAIIILAFMRRLPLRMVAILAALLFLGYPLLVALFPPDSQQPLPMVTTVLFQYHRDAPPFVETPLMGRLSLALAGYVLGRLLSDGRITISARWLWAAPGGLVVWFVLRLGLLQGYGDFLPYEPGTPWMNFLIDSKHPPSLTFLPFNMSWSLVLLVALQSISKRLVNTFIGWTLSLLGQTALFFFVAHMLFYKAVEVALGGDALIPSAWVGNHDLIRLFAECALTLVVLVPLCAIYRDLRRKYSILSYL